MVIKLAIVDDKLIVRTAIIEKLSSAENIVIVAQSSDGEEFLNLIEGLPKMKLPDVVLVDLEMPRMNGIQTIVQASTLYPEMKFIVLTVYDNSQKIFEAIKAGANGYLLKDDPSIKIGDAVFQVMKYNSVPMSPAIARKTLTLLKSDNAKYSF